MTRTVLPLIAAILLIGSGCDRNIAPFDPDEQPRQPDLSRIFPEPENVAPVNHANELGSIVGSKASASADQAGEVVRGTIRLVEGEGSISESVLFVIARPAGTSGGPPLAVLRVSSPEFPFEFTIGQGNVMIPAMRFEGSIELTARLDADGNASTRAEGDRSTAAPIAVSPGDVGVEIRLE